MARRLAFLILALTMVLAACGGASTPTPTTTQAPSPKLNVVVTSTQLADFVRVVGGDQVNLSVLATPNQTISSFVPQADDVTALARADVIIRVGVGLDSWLDPELGDSRATLADASEGITIENRVVNGARVKDPYYWMSPVNARIMVANVTDVLVQRDASRTEAFRSNERAYSAQLDSLRRDTVRTLSSIVSPKIVTSANNFGYYAKEYGINYVGSVDSMAQPELVAAIKTQGVKAVFTDTTSAATPSFAVASASGTRPITGADMLYIESLGADGSSGASYISAMRHNADVLVANLG